MRTHNISNRRICFKRTGLHASSRRKFRLEETQDDIVYFDIRRENGVIWASPIQTYLELMSGDKRDRETAAQVADGILTTVV